MDQFSPFVDSSEEREGALCHLYVVSPTEKRVLRGGNTWKEKTCQLSASCNSGLLYCFHSNLFSRSYANLSERFPRKKMTSVGVTREITE